MSNLHQSKKQILLSLFKENLQLYGRLNHKFMCPTCLKYVGDEDVTFAHVIPRSVTRTKAGWRTLQCKKCNSHNGNSIDYHIYFLRNEHKGIFKVRIDGIRCNFIIYKDKPSKIEFQSKTPTPNTKKRILDMLQSGKLEMELIEPNYEMVDKSVCTSVYLALFSIFGYNVLETPLHKMLIMDKCPVIKPEVNLGHRAEMWVLENGNVAVLLNYKKMGVMGVVLPPLVKPYDLQLGDSLNCIKKIQFNYDYLKTKFALHQEYLERFKAAILPTNN